MDIDLDIQFYKITRSTKIPYLSNHLDELCCTCQGSWCTREAAVVQLWFLCWPFYVSTHLNDPLPLHTSSCLTHLCSLTIKSQPLLKLLAKSARPKLLDLLALTIMLLHPLAPIWSPPESIHMLCHSYIWFAMFWKVHTMIHHCHCHHLLVVDHIGCHSQENHHVHNPNNKTLRMRQ